MSMGFQRRGILYVYLQKKGIMSTSNIFIVHPATSEQESALKAFVKALKIKFEVAESPYNPVFVDKIKKSRKEIEQGDVTRVEKADLQHFLGL